MAYRLPKLSFLDAAPISPDERAEGLEKGDFLVARKPRKQTAAPPGAAGAAAGAAGTDAASLFFGGSSAGAGAMTSGKAGGAGAAGAAAGAADALPGASGAAAEQDKRKPSAYLGIGTTHYDGRHSEGNRFILDRDL